MTIESTKMPIKEWEETINKMSYDELQEYIADPDICYPEFLELVKKKMDELIPEHEQMKNKVKKCLEELGCPCGVNEDGNLNFLFEGSRFLLKLGEDDDYIEIHDYCWNMVSLDDTENLERLKHAVNYANANSSVTTVYFTDDDEQYMGVYCTTSILYRSMISNLRDYLAFRLHEFFHAHYLVNVDMVLMKEREKNMVNED